MQRLVGSEWTEEPAAEGVALLGLHREVNPPKGERLAQRILELAAAGGRAFIVDLSAVDALDPRAMTPLLRAARRLRPEGVRVSVVFDTLLTVFTVEGLNELYDVAVTREDALARISRPPSPANGS